nr:hypothetical protein BOH68_11570 [Cobetia sp. MM1IDA2H-1]
MPIQRFIKQAIKRLFHITPDKFPHSHYLIDTTIIIKIANTESIDNDSIFHYMPTQVTIIFLLIPFTNVPKYVIPINL